VSGPGRNRPRSSKKRRAISGQAPPPTQRVQSGSPRARRDSRDTNRSGLPFGWIAVALVAAAAVLIAFATGTINLGGGSAAASASPRASGETGASGCPKAPPAALASGQKRIVSIGTAKGTIEITVEADLGPRAAGNFVALAECGFYRGIVFHRLVPGFVIQGGDPGGTGSGGPGYTFPDDPVGVAYDRGVVAMANSGPNTNGSQFFIVLAPNQLAPNSSVFGRVTAGMDVVDAIAAMPNSGPPNNAAVNPVAMDSVTVRIP
jgi:cyclophilin family peptidyl-prolyl cis-trans isomerase